MEPRSIPGGLLLVAASDTCKKHQQYGGTGDAYSGTPLAFGLQQTVYPAQKWPWPHPMRWATAHRQGRLSCANTEHSVPGSG